MNTDRPHALDFADFAAEAEQRRLGGDALAALEIAEAGLSRAPDDLRGRIVLALARIDLGDVIEARDELAAALSGAASASQGHAVATGLEDEAALESDLESELDEDELETAFAQAESDPDQMMDANRVVEQTLRAAELDTPETDFDLSSHPTYATESMAGLLDLQGRRAEAEALRGRLSSGAAGTTVEGPELEFEARDASQQADWDAAALGPDHARRLRVVATLEGWLHNLRRAENGAQAGARGGVGGRP